MRRRNQLEVDSNPNDPLKRSCKQSYGSDAFNNTQHQTKEINNFEELPPMKSILTEIPNFDDDPSSPIRSNTRDTSWLSSENSRPDLEEYDSTYSSMDDDGPDGFDNLAVNLQKGPLRRSTSSLTYANTMTGERSVSSRSSKALITEGDPSSKGRWGEDNWLVDDMPHQSSKRKRKTKQVTLTGKIARTSKKSSNRTRNRTSSNQRQARDNSQALLHETAPATLVTANVEYGANVTINTTYQSRNQCDTQSNTNHTADTVLTPAVVPGPTPMRLQVKIQDKAYLIPCPLGKEGESRTIAWLADQVSLVLLYQARPIAFIFSKPSIFIFSRAYIQHLYSVSLVLLYQAGTIAFIFSNPGAFISS